MVPTLQLVEVVCVAEIIYENFFTLQAIWFFLCLLVTVIILLVIAFKDEEKENKEEEWQPQDFAKDFWE